MHLTPTPLPDVRSSLGEGQMHDLSLPLLRAKREKGSGDEGSILSICREVLLKLASVRIGQVVALRISAQIF